MLSGSSSLALQRTLVQTTPLPSSYLRSHIYRATPRHPPRIISRSAQSPRLHWALIPNPSSGDNGLHRDLCQAPIYCGRKPPHAYALSSNVNAFEREAKENSATLVAHELVRGELRSSISTRGAQIGGADGAVVAVRVSASERHALYAPSERPHLVARPPG